MLLDHDGRHRRRVTLCSHGGREFLLDLAEAVRLRDGDGLGLETGETIIVRAQPEPLLDISADVRGSHGRASPGTSAIAICPCN